MDSGPILGISSGVKIDLKNVRIDEIREFTDQGLLKGLLEDTRISLRDRQDITRNFSENGDWTVFPL